MGRALPHVAPSMTTPRMVKTAATSALLSLPPVAGQGALRAGLMAMSILPTVLPSERRERNRCLGRLAGDAPMVAFIDISPGRSDTLTMPEVMAMLPDERARSRVYLTRLAAGHVSEADRHRVRSLGFADLVADLDASDYEGQLRATLDAVASTLSVSRLSPAELARYARVMSPETDQTSPRAVIRSLTGLSAEGLASVLLRSLAIEDRSYRLQDYPSCFIGSEAVEWMRSRLHRSRAEAVALGQALGTLGLLVHVRHDHPFLDDQLFYRVAWSTGPDALDLNPLNRALRGREGLSLATRRHLGKTYERCWVGSEAVTWVVRHFKVSRLDGWLALHRLMQFGEFEHVTRARPFIDGDYYYRFCQPIAASIS